MRVLFFFMILLLFVNSANAQEKADTAKAIKVKQTFFASIFTGFYYSLNEDYAPKTGFDYGAGLFGYKVDWNDKATVILIYDVTKTTGDIIVTDTSGNTLPLSYNKGSDYTAFLKQAEICFKPKPWLEISVGELLNQQYFSLQDKFWGYRYISTTFQEVNRFGNPADFGARITYKKKDILNFSIGTLNGDGPFRRQDNDANMQYFSNVEYFPVKGFSIKAYADYLPVEGKTARSAIAFFMGYRCDKWRLGAEYNRVENYLNIKGNTLEGTSVYGSYKIIDKWHALIRWDNLIKTSVYSDDHYIIAGGEYEPYKGLFVSLNGRFLTEGEIPWIFMNFGAKF